MWRSVSDTGGLFDRNPVFALIETGNNVSRFVKICYVIDPYEQPTKWSLANTGIDVESTGWKVLCWKPIEFPTFPSDYEVAALSAKALEDGLVQRGYKIKDDCSTKQDSDNGGNCNG